MQDNIIIHFFSIFLFHDLKSHGWKRFFYNWSLNTLHYFMPTYTFCCFRAIQLIMIWSEFCTNYCRFWYLFLDFYGNLPQISLLPKISIKHRQNWKKCGIKLKWIPIKIAVKTGVEPNHIYKYKPNASELDYRRLMPFNGRWNVCKSIDLKGWCYSI